MPIIQGKFGLTVNEVRSARERWRKIAHDCTWETFDDYLKWMVDSGWQKYKHIAKLDSDLPHGPENSIWVTLDAEDMIKLAQSSSIPDVGNPFCDACAQNGQDVCKDHGCAKWQDYFRKNWDEKIYCPKPVERKKEYFRYPHPDDIREGRA